MLLVVSENFSAVLGLSGFVVIVSENFFRCIRPNGDSILYDRGLYNAFKVRKEAMSGNSAQEKNSSTPLKKYRRVGKKLTPPLATFENMQTQSWINERLPEMLWVVLIRNHHSDSNSYAIFRNALRWLGEQRAVIGGATHTDIAGYADDLRTSFIQRIVMVAGTDALRPLLLLPGLPAANDWKKALSVESVPEKDWTHLADAVSRVMFHQSQEATDCRWVKLMGTILSGKVRFMKGQEDMVESFNRYPDHGDQKSVRPQIRAMEMMDGLTEPKYQWAKKFWDYCYENTACIPEINEKSQAEIIRKQAEISRHKKHYHSVTPGVRDALISHFFNTSKTSAVDSRHEAVFGLTLYALDIFIENILLLTSATTNGRVSARIILEAYLILAYLVHKEKAGENLWDTYRDYGIGQVSLIERKYQERGYVSAMVDLKKMGIIANEDKWSEFVPINLGHWDVSNLRKISVAIGEKELYDKYYDYTSGYVHANWGAVREAAFQRCFNSLHRLHRVPGYGLPILPNVNNDSREIVNKMLVLVDNTYPKFRDRIAEPSHEG